MGYFSYLVELRVLRSQNNEVKAPVAAPIAPEKIPPTDSAQTFLRQIGRNAGTKLIRLSMSDHYIEAHTDTGTHLVYMRFADALDALGTAEGAQVHRFHRVHFSEIKSVSKDGSDHAFLMSDNALAPIARSHKKKLQALGIL